MTHPSWQILSLSVPQCDLSVTTLEEAFSLMREAGDSPLRIGSAEESAHSEVVRWVEINHPDLHWVAIPTEIMTSPYAWYVWGWKTIVISQGVI